MKNFYNRYLDIKEVRESTDVQDYISGVYYLLHCYNKPGITSWYVKKYMKHLGVEYSSDLNFTEILRDVERGFFNTAEGKGLYAEIQEAIPKVDREGAPKGFMFGLIEDSLKPISLELFKVGIVMRHCCNGHFEYDGTRMIPTITAYCVLEMSKETKDKIKSIIHKFNVQDFSGDLDKLNSVKIGVYSSTVAHENTPRELIKLKNENIENLISYLCNILDIVKYIEEV